MKLQGLTIIFIIIILPITLVLSSYIGYEIRTINRQNMYNTGVIQATHDAIFAYEINTRNDQYSNNAEKKRSNIKASVKTFENSLSNACKLGLYNNDAIEEYIPAMVFGMYDGFYMYAPSETKKGYKHNLRNYVYYSENIKSGDVDIVINYTLDNYIAVSGKVNGTYVTKAGYLTNYTSCFSWDFNESKGWYKIWNGMANISYGISRAHYDANHIYMNDNDEEDNKYNKKAMEFYKESVKFTEWFNKNFSEIKGYLEVGAENDPEDPNSAFTKHKNEIIKQKIENVLNSSITAYSNKTGKNTYKMPKLDEEDWEKIYNNISVIALVQGMDLGFKKYNNYCVLNSTNSNEYVNPNLMYFITKDGDKYEYHDIRCTKLNESGIEIIGGYGIGKFEPYVSETEKDDGSIEKTYKYYNEYIEKASACYGCINGNDTLDKTDTFKYIRAWDNRKIVNKYYAVALANERNNTTKLLNDYNTD